MFYFGNGSVWATPLVDASGNAIAVPTPVKLGVLQDISMSADFDTKLLYGQQQFAVAAGRGKAKGEIKAKNALFNAAAWNLMYGQTITTGIVRNYFDQTGQAIPTTPFQITITPASSGVFVSDLGVRNAAGQNLIRVASGPTTGQYSVNTSTGVYTFATADAGGTVFIDYQYSATSTSAKKVTITNLLMGAVPSFALDMEGVFEGKNLTMHFYKTAPKSLAFGPKQDDFGMSDFASEILADANGNVFSYYLPE